MYKEPHVDLFRFRHASSDSVISYELWSCSFWRPCFLSFFHLPWLLHTFCLFSHRVRWAQRGQFGGDITFTSECSVSLTVYIISDGGYLNLFPFVEEGRVSDDGWTRHWSMNRVNVKYMSYRELISKIC